MIINESYQDKIARLFPIYNTDSKIKTISRTITFAVCDECNMCCIYCYEINKGKNYMMFETAKKFIDILLADKNEYINTSNSPAIIIEFIGGEPFMAINVMSQITDYFISQMIEKHHLWATRFRISISSNGTLYFESKVQEYIKKHNKYLSLNITIDGNKLLHDSCRIFPDGSGSYDLAMKAVRHYVDIIGGNMGSKMTIAPSNIIYTAEAVIGLIESGYSVINLNCVYEKGWDQEHATIFYYQLRKLADYIIDNNLYNDISVSIFQEFLGCPIPEDNIDTWCGAYGYMIAIDHKGDIYPCIRFMETSLGDQIEPVIIGNVDDGLLSTKKQCDWMNCLNCVTRKTQSTDECFTCPIAQGCSSCAAYNYQETGKIDSRVTYICELHKSRVLCNVYFWNLMNGR